MRHLFDALNLQRRALYWDEGVDRHRLRVLREGRECVDKADTVLVEFTHANDPAAAHADARFTHLSGRGDGGWGLLLRVVGEAMEVEGCG